MENKTKPILVVGENRLAYSIVVCLLQAGHPVTLCTNDKNRAIRNINVHFIDLSRRLSKVTKPRDLEIIAVLETKMCYDTALAITDEDILIKKSLIHQLEKGLAVNAAVAINTESISLDKLQEDSRSPARIIGMNWSEPAHTTHFLELITNNKSNHELAGKLCNLAKTYWHKNPYIVNYGISIRARIFAAMVREAFYLVENDYASVEDIDRACRNDAGYYLPFDGIFRYMDLMGTYSYGAVMKDLNAELSKEDHLPVFFKRLTEEGKLGMDSRSGFYHYDDDDIKRWNKLFRKFSYQIEGIINKYPFNYKNDNL